MSTDVFTWNPNPDELFYWLPENSMHVKDSSGAVWGAGPAQIGRWSSVTRTPPGHHTEEVRSLLEAPHYRDGSLHWLIRPADAFLLRDALRHQGHQADLLVDEASDDAAWVIITSRTFASRTNPA